MRKIRSIQKLLPAIISIGLLTACATSAPRTQVETGFVSLFNGHNLDGWVHVGKKGEGYIVKDGAIVCTKGSGGNLLTERQFSDFILRFDFKLEEASNNGIAIRSPLEGAALAYKGMEIQILDDGAPKYKDLKPWQAHGSLYGVVPARRGALKRVGQWNSQEITCVGREITVKVNGKVVLDTDINDITDPEILHKHPGLLRPRGHIGFLGHDDYVEYRNIRIKELPAARVDNRPPEGFKALFNGRDLSGWQGSQGDPAKRSEKSLEDWARAQVEADILARRNWVVNDGVIAYTGKGFDNLSTTRDYRNFELLVDWKTEGKSDSGIYLRGTPQVQIWDNPEGSGGLWNNKKNPSKPAKRADSFPGNWNRFRILMTGEKVTVFLNSELVVHNVTMENYWKPGEPVYPLGPIELQAHETPVYFKNIFIRELP